MAPRLILASNSIRRYDLLGQVGIVPDIVDPSNVDETNYDQSLPPHQIALMLARKKAHSISENEQYKNDYILAADTVVAIGRKIIEKTEDIEKAREILNLLSGRNHRVLLLYAYEIKKVFFIIGMLRHVLNLRHYLKVKYIAISILMNGGVRQGHMPYKGLQEDLW